ncbi:hypothetical protein GCM10019016_063120 [Streptomyces prasinosporus]|uniref:Uncharacterized protein n=1 Tax=Streptomyces prasinosporus TaxID=68256 RepID=A0ABP6TWS4_9ACTN
MLVLEDEDVPGDLGGDVGVAVAVAADPGAEGEGAGVVGELDADALQFRGEVLEDVADRARVQLVEVVDGVAGLVGGFGADHAQFVGLPDEVDVLGEPGVEATAVGLDDRGVEEGGDPAELVEDGAAGGLGGVGGEHGADVEVLDRLAQVLGVGVLEPVRGAGEQSALGGAAGAQFAAAVDLLGDVGQVEVGGEGADQLGRGLQFGTTQQLGGGLAVLTGESADLLDEVQQLGALLPYEGLPEEIAQSADVGAQLAARRVVWSSALLTGAAPCSVEARLEGTRTASRAAGAAYGPDVREEIRADRAVRPTSRIGLGPDAQADGLLPWGDALPYLRCRRLRDRRKTRGPRGSGTHPHSTYPPGDTHDLKLRCDRRRREEGPVRRRDDALRHAGRGAEAFDRADHAAALHHRPRSWRCWPRFPWRGAGG